MEQEREAAGHLRKELDGLRITMREFEAEREVSMVEAKLRADGEMEALRREISTLEAERESLSSDVAHLKNALGVREENISSLKRTLEEERLTSRRINEDLRQTEVECDLQIQHAQSLEHQLAAGSEWEKELQVVRQQLTIVMGERDELKSDMTHMTNANHQREHTISSLRENLQTQKAEVAAMREELQIAQEELQAARATAASGSRSSVQDEEMRINFKVITTENDQLKADIMHLKNANNERQDTISKLREEAKTLKQDLSFAKEASVHPASVHQASVHQASMTSGADARRFPTRLNEGR